MGKDRLLSMILLSAKVGKTCQTSERIWSVFVAGDKCERI